MTDGAAAGRGGCGVRVRPIRFTDDVAAMRRFCEALGLAADVVSDGGGWVTFTAPAGGAALHDAASSDGGCAPGTTELSFEYDGPLEELEARLHAAGFADAHVVDESYGRDLVVTDPDGVTVIVNEVQHDLHGYARVGETVAPG